MGSFTAGTGTLYHSLYEGALKAFAIETQMLEQVPCYGDPGGMNVHCELKIGDLNIWIETPQCYGEHDHHGGRTSGVLRACCVLDANSPDLAWIDPARIAEAFSVQPILDIFSKQQTIESVHKRVERAKHRLAGCIKNAWLSESAKMPAGWTDNRSAVLFSGRNQRMFACQVRGPSDGTPVECPSGFPCRIRLAAGQRFEFFLYEFQLSGTNSWNFQLATD